MKLLLLAVAVLMGSIACSMESSADRASKASLIGSWYYEFNDPSERMIKGIASLKQDGTFTERLRVAGEPSEEVAKGVWHVTEGMLKLDSMERNGNKMGTLGDRYRTCALANLTATAFDCSFGGGGLKLRFQRIENDRQLS